MLAMLADFCISDPLPHFEILHCAFFPEMQKAASMASMLVLFFLPNCANFWALGAQRLCNCYFLNISMYNLCNCAICGLCICTACPEELVQLCESSLNTDEENGQDGSLKTFWNNLLCYTFLSNFAMGGFYAFYPCRKVERWNYQGFH